MTKLEGFVDHIEKEGAVVCMADRVCACVSSQTLPSNVHEGDFVVEDNDELTVDPVITELHHREIRRMSESYFE